MGAHGMAQTLTGSTPEDAYRAAVDQARWEHGNGGYTGSIAESNGYKVARPRTRHEAGIAAEHLLNGGSIDGLKAEKWGYTVLIPIRREEEVRTVEFSVDVTGIDQYDRNEYGGYSGTDQWTAAAQRAATVKLRDREHIMSVHWITGDADRWGRERLGAAAALAKRVTSTIVSRTKGERRTVWAVVNGTGPSSTIKATTADLDEAKRLAGEYAARGHDGRFGIVQMTVRDDGGNGFLYAAKHEVTKNVLGVRAVIGRNVPGAPEEFLAVGTYSS